MTPRARHSRGVNFALGLPSSKLPTFSAGGNPAKQIRREATKPIVPLCGYLYFHLDSRLRGNDDAIV
jgi:hypothetical protein